MATLHLSNKETPRKIGMYTMAIDVWHTHAAALNYTSNTHTHTHTSSHFTLLLSKPQGRLPSISQTNFFSLLEQARKLHGPSCCHKMKKRMTRTVLVYVLNWGVKWSEVLRKLQNEGVWVCLCFFCTLLCCFWSEKANSCRTPVKWRRMTSRDASLGSWWWAEYGSIQLRAEWLKARQLSCG